MPVESVRIFSSQTNGVVIESPGRNYPGIVIQGDSLANICGQLGDAISSIEGGDSNGEEALLEIKEVYYELLWRTVHYQNVLQESGIKLPYSNTFSTEELEKLGHQLDNGDDN